VCALLSAVLVNSYLPTTDADGLMFETDRFEFGFRTSVIRICFATVNSVVAITR